ncbi:hypothetical protein B296_00052401, partial [Ensete ventricosum]
MLGDGRQLTFPLVGRGSHGAVGCTPPHVGSGLGGSGKPPREAARLRSRKPLCASLPAVGSGRGAGAYVVGVVDHSYLTIWLLLWLTMSSYTSTMPAVLA